MTTSLPSSARAGRRPAVARESVRLQRALERLPAPGCSRAVCAEVAASVSAASAAANGHARQELRAHEGAEDPRRRHRRRRDSAGAPGARGRRAPRAARRARRRRRRATSSATSSATIRIALPVPVASLTTPNALTMARPVLGEVEGPVDGRLEPEVERRDEGRDDDDHAEDARDDPAQPAPGDGEKDQHDRDRLRRQARAARRACRVVSAPAMSGADTNVANAATVATRAPRRAAVLVVESAVHRQPSRSCGEFPGRLGLPRIGLESIRQGVPQQDHVADPAGVGQRRPP